LGERHDVWSVNTEKEYHEEERVARPKAVDRRRPERVSVSVPEAIGESADRVIAAAFAKIDPLAMGIALSVVSGLGVFMATAILLLRGGPAVGPTLSLIGNYLLGFEVTWTGALLGLLEGGMWGFALGAVAAGLRNSALKSYAKIVRWRQEREDRRNLLDKI
jgi:hypothetical protein